MTIAPVTENETPSTVRGVIISSCRLYTHEIISVNTLEKRSSVATTATDASGLYRFDRLQPGTTYTVCLDAPADSAAGGPLAGFELTGANAGADDAVDSDAALRNGAPFAELPEAFRTLQQHLLKKPGGDREIMTVPEMIELFSPDGLQKKAAIFDPQKLD